MFARHRGLFVTGLLLLLTSGLVSAQAVPTSLSYQGKLTDSSGQPVPDGNYQVQFKLYTVESGGTAFWTSPSANVSTSGGVFTTQIQPLTPADLSGKSDVWLETWTGNPLVALSPRVKLLSSPFSFRSGDLTLPFAGTTAASGVAFDIASTGTGQGLRASAQGTGYAASFEASSSDAVYAHTAGTGNAVEAYCNGPGRAGYFSLNEPGSSSDAVYATTNADGSAVYATTSGTGTAIKGYVSAAGAIPGSFQIVNAGNSLPALVGSTTGSGDALRGYTTGTGHAGYFRVNNAGNSTSALFSETNGTGGSAEFAITNAASTADAARATTIGSGDAVEGYATGTGRAGHFQIANASSPAAAILAETSGTGVALHANNTVSGTWAKLGTAYYGIHGQADMSGGRGVYGLTAGQSGYGVYGEATNYQGYGVYGKASTYGKYGVFGETSSATGTGVYAVNTADAGTGLYARGGANGWAGSFSGKLRVLDRETESTVIELGKGLDYAEGFDVSGDSEAKPGTVLVIDPDNPGQLTVSSKPYDRRVAGIVAGAKGIGSGVRLGADGFDHDVALAGRVYCNVDATLAAVEPGDLLTTSVTPGYAMKVTNYSTAQGAILGKAMERLERGSKGQILVLVTLQ